METSRDTRPSINPSAFTGPEWQFAGDKTLVEAFTDPQQVPAPAVLELIETAITNRPDAAALCDALLVRFAKARGLSDYGITVQDTLSKTPGSPSHNPNTLYITPHARPTAGAITMPAYHTDQGELYVALVRNLKNPMDPSQGYEHSWRFPGGFMEARMPNNPSGRAFDANLQQTAMREVMEETGLDFRQLNITPKELFTRSDSGAQTNAPSHAIDTFFLADMGRRNEAPPVRAGDDVGMIRWINLRDISLAPGSPSFSGYNVTVDGQTAPLHPYHHELLEKGVAELRQKMFPLHEPGNCTCCKNTQSPLQTESREHYDKVAQAHGFNSGLHITINIQPNSWQHKLTQQQATANKTPPTLH